MTFTPSSTRIPSLVEHDVVGWLGESRLGRITKMLVVVEVRGRVEVFLLPGRVSAVGVGILYVRSLTGDRAWIRT
jgi:hypothetical protein